MVNEGDRIRDIMMSAPSDQVYADYTYDHMVELIDRYHPDILWADIGYPSKGRQGELFEYYFSEVPEGTVNDRWGPVDALGEIARIPGVTWVLKTLGRIMLSNQSANMEDDPARFGYKTAEYDSFVDIPPFKWETTRGLGGSFAYNSSETAADMLSSNELIDYLIDTVSKNGNVLINVGPDSFGQIPIIQQAPLLGLGNWMAVNSEAIYATRPWTRFHNKRGRELRYTRNDTALYAIVLGDVDASFTIEEPGTSYSNIGVLGAKVIHTNSTDGILTIDIDKPMAGPAVVVRFDLP